MTNSKCADISELISPFIDGELSPEEDSLVLEHIGNCSSCNKVYTRISGTVSLTQGLPSIEADPAVFVTDLRKKIDLSSSRWFPESFYSLSGKLAMTGACLLLIISAGYQSSGPSPLINDDRPMVVAVASPRDNVKISDNKEKVTAPAQQPKVPVVIPVRKTNIDTPPEISGPLVIHQGGNVLASITPVATSYPDKPKVESPHIVTPVNTQPVSTSGIDWDKVDLKKASAAYYSSTGERMRPPVFTTFEQIQFLYGNVASDVSNEANSVTPGAEAGGFILLEVNDQTAFFPSFHSHLLNDEDYEVSSISYNQYDESFIIVKYNGSNAFEASFNSFASRIDKLDSIVGILSVKSGESASTLLQLTIRPASQLVGK